MPALVRAQDSSASTADSTVDSLHTTTHLGPLGMDDLTGLSLYIVVLLLLVLSLYLWRKSINAQRLNR